MASASRSLNDNGGRIYTLAQSWTENSTNEPRLLSGQGSDLNNTDALKGKAKRKVISQCLAITLVDIAKERGHCPKQFWNTYHCQQKVFTHEGKLHGQYCKNRICTLCNANRKADIINRYLPVMETWPDPQFLTLTIVSVRAIKLRFYVKAMLRAFKEIKDAQRKRHQRGKGIELIGIKSLECNFNPIRKTYNPHFHLLVPDKATAKLLVDEWLKKWTTKHARKGGQDIRPIRKDKAKQLMEVVKYGSKIFTEPDLNKKSQSKTPRLIYANALYNILHAMKGHRLFDRFGFDLPKTTLKPETKNQLANNYESWFYDPRQYDWVNSENDEVLTEYELTSQLEFLLGNNINTVLQ